MHAVDDPLSVLTTSVVMKAMALPSCLLILFCHNTESVFMPSLANYPFMAN